jgi:hypothetical protein
MIAPLHSKSKGNFLFKVDKRKGSLTTGHRITQIQSAKSAKSVAHNFSLTGFARFSCFHL